MWASRIYALYKVLFLAALGVDGRCSRVVGLLAAHGERCTRECDAERGHGKLCVSGKSQRFSGLKIVLLYSLFFPFFLLSPASLRFASIQFNCAQLVARHVELD